MAINAEGNEGANNVVKMLPYSSNTYTARKIPIYKYFISKEVMAIVIIFLFFSFFNFFF